MKENNIPVLPAVMPWTDEIFFDDDLCDLWDDQLKKREAFICDLVRKYTALQIADKNDPERFFVISPGIRDKKYSLTRFDALGAIWDAQRDTPEEFVSEIANDAVLVDVFI